MTSLMDIRRAATESLEKFKEFRLANTNEDTANVIPLTEEQVGSIFQDFPGATKSNFYGHRYTINGPLEVEYVDVAGKEAIENAVKYLESNRTKAILWFAYTNAINNELKYTSGINVRWYQAVIGEDTSTTYDSNVTEERSYYKIFKSMSEARIGKEDFLQGLYRYNESLKDLNRKLEIFGHKPSDAKSGIEKVFANKPAYNSPVIESQLQELIAKMPVNGLASRTWGWEIEVPDAKGVTPAVNSGIEKGEDGSLRSYENDGCECSCNDCNYHECNCDNCSDYNDDPDHGCGSSDCNTADMAEFRTTGGIQRLRHSGMFDLLERLNAEDAEINDTAGTHIHVYAKDLTTNQIGHAMAIYTYCENIMSVIAGRYDVNYAGQMRVDAVKAALRKSTPVLMMRKPIAMNLSHVGSERGTVEFRQMDCNLNAERITFWAWLVRGVIEIAKRGAQIQNAMHIKDLNDLVELMAKYDYTLEDEKPNELIPGSRVDKFLIKTEKHEMASSF